MKEIDNDIKNQSFKKCYLFYGDEDYLKTLYTEKLKKIINEGTEMMNITVFDGENSFSADDFINNCEIVPFMSEKRLVIIKNSGFFKKGSDKGIITVIADYIKEIPDTTVVLFIEKEVNKALTLFKRIKKEGYCTEFKTPDFHYLTNWVEERAKENGRTISKSAAEYLITSTEGDMTLLNTEIEKLTDYTQKSITEKDIDDICSKSISAVIFSLVDAIGEKNTQKALDIYSNLILYKQSPYMILAMIARQFRYILRCSALKSRPIYEISSMLKLRDFQVREFLRQGKNFSAGTAVHALQECQEYDTKMKTGLIDDETGVEMLIVKYSS